VADSPRIQELRRRVQQDPASLAFAPLAEELRRAGRAQEAVTLCQNGLAHHPEYVSARATLGRALLDLGEVESAFLELSAVLSTAPENLIALRGVAEVHHRRGELAEAVAAYRRARAVAPQDADLEQAIATLERSKPAGPAAPETAGTQTRTLAAPPVDTTHEEDRRQVRGLQKFLDQILADRARRPAARA
jgi:cellulose synthase operon protein C